VTDRRSQIIDAAARLMGQRGFAPTSVDDVIKEAKLSGKSHFYHYFRRRRSSATRCSRGSSSASPSAGLAVLREPMIDPLERLALFIDTLVALQIARGLQGGSPFGSLAAELADTHDGFRERIARGVRAVGGADPLAPLGGAPAAARRRRHRAARALHHRHARGRAAHGARQPRCRRRSRGSRTTSSASSPCTVRDAGPAASAPPRAGARRGGRGAAGWDGPGGGRNETRLPPASPDALAVFERPGAVPAARPSATSRAGAAAMPAGRVVAAAAQRVSA
jgi:AcrR family transcriptional regulator